VHVPSARPAAGSGVILEYFSNETSASVVLTMLCILFYRMAMRTKRWRSYFSPCGEEVRI
jgi:hypothetical protein